MEIIINCNNKKVKEYEEILLKKYLDLKEISFKKKYGLKLFNFLPCMFCSIVLIGLTYLLFFLLGLLKSTDEISLTIFAVFCLWMTVFLFCIKCMNSFKEWDKEKYAAFKNYSNIIKKKEDVLTLKNSKILNVKTEIGTVWDGEVEYLEIDYSDESGIVHKKIIKPDKTEISIDVKEEVLKYEKGKIIITLPYKR